MVSYRFWNPQCPSVSWYHQMISLISELRINTFQSSGCFLMCVIRGTLLTIFTGNVVGANRANCIRSLSCCWWSRIFCSEIGLDNSSVVGQLRKHMISLLLSSIFEWFSDSEMLRKALSSKIISSLRVAFNLLNQ